MRKRTHYTLSATTYFWCCLAIILVPAVSLCQPARERPPLDILHYKARITPDLDQKALSGKVDIQFKVNTADRQTLNLSCGNLLVERVTFQNEALTYQQAEGRLAISLPATMRKGKHRISISYRGTPRRGILFFPEARQLYTVFSTDQWMPCRPAPEERASFELELVLPPGLTAVSNGNMKPQRVDKHGRVVRRWRLKEEVPAYCYGFAAGPMERFIEREYGVKFQYLSDDYTEKELSRIFRETPDMLRFFERKAGVKYPGTCYSQMLPKGSVSQEMQHFTVMRNNYGLQVLEKETDINLAAHELAHQWWGNQVTCRNWNHFWLNEGMAVFMSTAYREFRYGREAYLRDIAVYLEAYEKVIDKGLDKPLQFPNWDAPTAEDRTLVYYKGAYFLHVLREELGDRIFWKAIRLYTRKYFGKSVVSSDLQRIMERVSRKNLNRLFEEWVY